MRIGELAHQLGINPKSIRYYERIGLLPEPERTDAGYRIYGEADAERLIFIRKAQRLGLALNEIMHVIEIRGRSEKPCDYVIGIISRQLVDLDRRIADLVKLREQLLQLQIDRESVAAIQATYCDIIESFALEAANG